MITKRHIIDWLKAKDPGLIGKIYNGTIDKDKDYSLGVYKRNRGRLQPESSGKRSGYGYTAVTLLLHWGQDASVCERKALDLWEVLRNSSTQEQIGPHSAWIEARMEPVDVGRDERLICEMTLDFNIIYRKEY